jgi:hypothetical protein
MLQFAGGVSCRVFQHEIAVLLHHASTWAAIAGVTIVVMRLVEVPDVITRELAADLTIELNAARNRSVLLLELGAYLGRTLGRGYTVQVEFAHVRVTWAFAG